MNDIGCMGMMALGHEDFDSQVRIADYGGIQPLIRLLRITRTSAQVMLAVVCALASLCIGQCSSISRDENTERAYINLALLYGSAVESCFTHRTDASVSVYAKKTVCTRIVVTQASLDVTRFIHSYRHFLNHSRIRSFVFVSFASSIFIT